MQQTPAAEEAPPRTTLTKVMVLRDQKWVHDGTYNLTNPAGQFVNLSQEKLEIAHGVLYDAGFRMYNPDPVEKRGMVVSMASPVGVLEYRYVGHRSYKRGEGIQFKIDQQLFKEMGDQIPTPF